MTEKDYAQKIFNYDNKEKALIFVTDNFYDDDSIKNEKHPNYKQSLFISNVIKNSEELTKLKNEVLNYIESYDEEQNEEEYFSKLEPSKEEEKKLEELLKLDWFNYL